jgi:hypothetical protein
MSRVLALGWLVAAGTIACTSARIEPADGGGGTSASGGASGGMAGTSSGGAAGGSNGGAAGGSTGGAAGGSTGGTGGGTGGAVGGAGGATGGTGGTASGGSGGGGAGRGGAGGTPTGGRGGSGAGGAGGGGGGAGGGSGGASGVTPTVAGQIVVTELMHDTNVVSDDFGEWFEVYNPDPATTYDLDGCQIRDTSNAHTIAAHLLVPPHAFRTLAIFATGGGFMPDYTYSGIKFDNDGADSVSIYCGATLIDRFGYTAAMAAVGGRAFSVDPAHYSAVDNDVPANVCNATTIYNQFVSGSNVVTDYGTPGAPNPSCN